jgi:hypothetical protein
VAEKLPAARVAGAATSWVAAFVAAPLRFTVSGLVAALSATLRTATRLPVAVGVKVTVKPQLPFGSIVLPLQLSAPTAKSAGLAPPIVIELTTSDPVPVLDTVTVCGALVENTA